MSAKIGMRICALLALAAAIGLSLHARRLRREAEMGVLAAGKRQALTEMRCREAANRLARAEKDIGDLGGFLAESMRSQARPTPQPLAKRPDPLSILIENPKLQARLFAIRRAQLTSLYGPLFKKLGLSPDQIENFSDLIVQHEEQMFDIAATVPAARQSLYRAWFLSSPPVQVPSLMVSLSQGSTQSPVPDAQAAATLLQQSEDSLRAAQISLLGSVGYQELQQYEQILPVHPVVDELEAFLSGTSDPLTADRAALLTQTLAENSAAYQKGLPASVFDIAWGQALPQASALLSPAQLAALNAIIAPQNTLNRLAAMVQNKAGN